ncbi:MAG: hypothetical protein NTY35_13730 [Planctomycetota bacterium]|nr:hypothetical protein [Planctomycetota bacterium]
MKSGRRPGQRVLGWTLFLVWAVSLAGLQGILARHAAGSWVPDAALVLSVVVLARCEVGDLALLALLTAFARAATSGEPPLVLFTGILGALLAALAVRGAFELSGPLGRTLATAIAAGMFQAWISIARDAREVNHSIDFAAAAGTALPVALASALLAFALGPLLARLPGLTPLWSRSW